MSDLLDEYESLPYTDATGRCCPDCKGTNITYRKIPEHRRIWGDGSVENVDHWPEARDYTCRDCEAVWVMMEEPL